MDPITLATAAVTFGTSIKDLVSVAKELTTFYKHARAAPAILDSLARELSLLAQILQRLDQVRQLAPEDDLLEASITNLSSKVVSLKTKVQLLLRKERSRRISTAWTFDTIQELMRNVESAKSTAQLALHTSQSLVFAQRFDALALQQTDTKQLYSQLTVAVQKQLAASSTTGESTTSATTSDLTPVTVTPQRRKQAGRRLLKFRFGPWIWDLAAHSAYGRWDYTLKAKRLISLDSAIMQAIESSDIVTLDRMLGTNHVSPYDENKVGHTLFTLAITHSKDPIQMLQVILKYTDQSMDVETFNSIMLIYLDPFCREHLKRAYLTSLSQLMIEASDADLLADFPDTSDTSEFFYLSTWCSDVDLFPLLRSRGSMHLLGQPADVLKLNAPGIRHECYAAVLYAYNIHPNHLNELDQAVKDWLLCALLPDFFFHKRKVFYSHYAMPSIEESMVMILRAGASPTVGSLRFWQMTPLHFGLCLANYSSGLHDWLTAAQVVAFVVRSWFRCLDLAGISLTDFMLQEANASASLNNKPLPIFLKFCGYTIYYSGLSLESNEVCIHLKAEWNVAIWTVVNPPGSWPRCKYRPEKICWSPRAEDYLDTDTTWKSSCVKSLYLDVDYSWLFRQSKDIYVVEPVSDDHGIIARSFLRARPASRQRSASQPRSIQELGWKTQLSKHQPLLRLCHVGAFEPTKRLHYVGRGGEMPFTDELSPCFHERCEEDIWSMLTEGLRKYIGGWTLKKATDGILTDDRWFSEYRRREKKWEHSRIVGTSYQSRNCHVSMCTRKID